jgi:DNA-binding NarL/FixJ family response regulator
VAVADRANGAVLLAEGDTRAALEALRRAFVAWQRLEAPYDTARVRVLIARSLRHLGDDETAAFELEAARTTFRELAAGPDLARVEALLGLEAGRPDGLSPRELEVLRLLAVGRTNREIASELGISERTVDRHVSNIFTKVDVSTRSAATAYAFEHELR